MMGWCVSATGALTLSRHFLPVRPGAWLVNLYYTTSARAAPVEERKMGRNEGSTVESLDTLDICPQASALGAEVRGVDIGDDLPRETIEALRIALHHHGVLFFREQSLCTDAAQVAL